MNRNHESHPSWVCGLKLNINLKFARKILSHTLRGCVDWNTNGWDISNAIIMSHPSWVCGLKLLSLVRSLLLICHTLRGCVDWNDNSSRSNKTSIKSHPSWVCGLKHHQHQQRPSNDWVTPFVGVWIETCHYRILWGRNSHTLRGCVDWNFTFLIKLFMQLLSHPSWVCGLKQKTDFIFWAHLKKSFLRKRAIDCQ